MKVKGPLPEAKVLQILLGIFIMMTFCNNRKATTYKEILDTWTAPYLPIKNPLVKFVRLNLKIG